MWMFLPFAWRRIFSTMYHRRCSQQEFSLNRHEGKKTTEDLEAMLTINLNKISESY